MKQILIFTFLLLATVCHAQSMEDANNLYRAGNYDKAKLIYYKFKKSNGNAAERYQNCIDLQSKYEVALEQYNGKKYRAAEAVCDKILAINAECQKTRNLRNRCEEAIKQLQRQREQDFQNARNSYSVAKLKDFQEKYSKQKEQVARAEEVITDLNMYINAREQNTREAYVNYISNSKLKEFKNEADEEIGRIDCKNMWSDIANSRKLSDFNEYLLRYKKYDYHISEAEAAIALLNGVESYRNNDLASAYNYFKIAESKNAEFTKDDNVSYRKSTEYVAYESIKNSNNINTLSRYITEYPQSECVPKVRSSIGILLANGLDYTSCRNDFSNALSYASDSSTRSYIESKIHEAKRDRWNYLQRTKGKAVAFGMDVDANYNKNILGVGLGVGLRFGRYCSPIIFNFNVNYTIYVNPSVEPDYDETIFDVGLYGAQLQAPAFLKLNLIPLGENTQMYFGCGVEYSKTFTKSNYKLYDNESYTDFVVKDKIISDVLSYIPTFGFSWRHADWGFYVKYTPDKFINDLDLDAMTNSKYVFGTQLNIYF